MSANYFDLMRYAKTGIAASGMTAYDKQKAFAMLAPKGGTYSGVPPISFRAKAGYLESYKIFGNSAQDGTPTPAFPVDVVGVGERTENLFDKDNITDAGQFYINSASGQLISSSNTCMFMIPCKPNTTYTVKRDATTTKRFVIGFVDDGNLYSGMPVPAFAYGDTAAVLTATSTAGSRYLLVYYAKKGGSDASTTEEIQSCLNTLMVVEGSTAPDSYIPYGYKIPVSCAGETTTIYIGENPLRKALDDSVFDELSSEGIIIRRVDDEGTPLSELITETITAPQIPVVNGRNTLSVETTVQPSLVTITV